jgi:hypothetical protein
MATQDDVKTVTGTIGAHYARQATPEVWAEVDELRRRVSALESALTRALTDVGCADEEKCPHWVEWHNIARQAMRPSNRTTP